MKISTLYDEMLTYFGNLENNDATKADTYKAGNCNNEITGVGISMFATLDVIRECIDKNINFLIVHEPVFYNPRNSEFLNKMAEIKKKIIEESKITIARFHDHAHIMNNDMIFEGEIKYSGLEGKKIPGELCAITRYELKNAVTAKELAEKLERTLGIKHIRIAGCTDKKGYKVSCCFGTPGHIVEELDENDFVLTGEICEWIAGETARDYSQLGLNKAILVMGHIGSERAGMMYLADIIKEKHPELNPIYIECGEVYSYTDK